MYKQSPGRRSKGSKVKHVLQISLFLAVCFWLIYQVKHSHDKKREFDESDARSSLQRESSDDFVKLGRKGIGVLLEETLSKNAKHDELEEEEVGETKSEEDELEGTKAEGNTDGMVGGEDDEIDEDDNEKLDEVDKEEDVVDGDEREDAVEDETREIETEDTHDRSEKEISFEETDHDVDNEINEAREEHYKADDASSAVTHSTENEDEWMENSKERPQKVLEEEIKENNSEETNEGEKGQVLDNSWNISPPNGSVTKGFSMSNNTPNDPELDNNSAIPTTNGTSAEVTHFQFSALHLVNNNSIVNVDNGHSGEPGEVDSNSEHFSNPPDNSTQLSASENVGKSENRADEGSKSNNESWVIQNDKIEDGNTDMKNGSDAVLESIVAQNHRGDDQHKPFESGVEKDVHKDILPEL